ncbi:TetR family transcriptional regulator [Nostoc spongiaeforme FACHB-130]|uniref:TetR family transcriptional regulator n=1 Tax=Nostoc spongiaeforme FACHB-130 TaxID=1357510 RepID=A0ABR8FZB9_9NOSO|nr:TetR/AcrR family transcriptional regulator [Nostoc spongiaeforme]MBD2595915.1 TetR family transcriptional regulator [Nostoc spongiaeforme FACHB-130]
MTKESQKASTMRRKPKQARSQERVHHILDVAEQLFIELGYEQTTTRAIATRAAVPVGSLYQFFPDKDAIVRALANRYFEQEYQMFVQLHTELAEADIKTYVDCMIDAFEQFAEQHPGYRAVLGRLIDFITVADASKWNEYDQQMLTEIAHFVYRRNPELDASQCDLIATTVFKAANELLWLSFARDQQYRKQLLAETKILITAYLQTYKI